MFRLSELLAVMQPLSVAGDVNLNIHGLAYDSRACQPGWLFFALPGIHTDGMRFVADAHARGAVAFVHQSPSPSVPAGMTAIQVTDCRYAMSAIADAFYGAPSKDLCVIGVTGTEGKSTTVYLIYQLLNAVGIRTGFFSTVMSDTGDGEQPNPEHQTTPESPAVHAMLARMRDQGLTHAVVESSSHGLSDRTARLAHVCFDIGVFTNVTHEHLEFHGTWEQYRSDKANLFRRLGACGKKTIGNRIITPAGVVCADDPSASYFIQASNAPCMTYASKGNAADLIALEVSSDSSGAHFTLEGPDGKGGRIRLPARINLPGRFNIPNTMAALLAASSASGIPWQSFLPHVPTLRPVRGRMQRIDQGQPFEVIIDYAHTPSSFLEILPPLRVSRKGRILCVFGSGGERDREKRPRQGRIAADYCDVVILADEDPRGEDRMALLEEIAAGCPELPRGERLFLIPDRREAIQKAFLLANAGDLVLLLGKGHENSIIFADHIMPYDEEWTARSLLADMGYRTGFPESTTRSLA
ncbi:MAG: UDP-N-acetylmuramoyl-L-alanyl-D-glutamate--2,6-diaminopimelate ligase [Spirochaetales bacterium]|nr:UDP-N-acetylmuramoyl-L-alanyl-D-glutamate--2,6-diaminopimelate ligase [Spirochaetales bacterium]